MSVNKNFFKVEYDFNYCSRIKHVALMLINAKNINISLSLAVLFSQEKWLEYQKAIEAFGFFLLLFYPSFCLWKRKKKHCTNTNVLQTDHDVSYITIRDSF